MCYAYNREFIEYDELHFTLSSLAKLVYTRAHTQVLAFAKYKMCEYKGNETKIKKKNKEVRRRKSNIIINNIV